MGLLGAAIVFASAAASSADVAVALRNGQLVRAQTAQESADGRTLLLRIEREGITLTRRVPLASVATVEHGGAVPTEGAVDAVGTSLPVSWLPVPVHQGPVVQDAAAGWLVHPLDCAHTPMFGGPPVAGGYGRVLGVRDDPLQAYAADALIAYPDGVPINEVPFALDLLRARRAAEVLPGLQPLLLVPPPLPLPPLLPPY